MPQTLHLDELPKELLALVATYLDTRSILALAFTNHPLRAATHDPLIYKSLLQQSPPPFNLSALNTCCNTDPNLWARYALARDLAAFPTTHPTPFNRPIDPIHYLPSLYLLSYPPSGSTFFPPTPAPRPTLDERPPMLFTLALTILSCPPSQLGLPNSPHYLPDIEATTCPSDMHALVKVAASLRAATARRRRVWPFNHDARVPFIDPPGAGAFAFEPRTTTYQLPPPFAEPKVWERWFATHSVAMVQDKDFMFGGTWVGYYTYSYDIVDERLDPPMMGIHFAVAEREVRVEGGDGSSRRGTRVEARRCWDGIGEFMAHGTIWIDDGGVEFRGEKLYLNTGSRRVSWKWDLRLTPVGWVGYWGVEGLRDDHSKREGFVWLWKEEWGEVTSEGNRE